ncbi:SDR family oxidoreductase [Rhodococcus opacus]|nr:SDR family oxidoreductase [Rhodococcus opacus]
MDGTTRAGFRPACADCHPTNTNAPTTTDQTDRRQISSNPSSSEPDRKVSGEAGESHSARLPEVGNLDYAAAKLALLALSTSLATEFGPQGIRSNVVVPGPTRTPLYDRPGGFGDQAADVWGIDKEAAITRMVTEIRPLLTGRMGQPDDLAQVVAYLVSPLSRQVTAAEWGVDGGAQRHI